MLHFEKNGFKTTLVLQREQGVGWLVKLPVPEHKRWDEERREALRTSFQKLEKLAAARKES